MQRDTRRTMVCTLALLLALAYVVMQACSADLRSFGTPDGRDISRKIDAYLEAAAKAAHIPDLSVSVTNSDGVQFAAHYGQDETVTPDTPYLLGSVSKAFTAACIMQLVEEGRIGLNAPISTYLPGVCDGHAITVRQLLNHTSGLGEFQTLGDCHITATQGDHHYANINYTLLGKIIQEVTGMSYEEYLTRNVLEPLRMTHTSASADKSKQDGLIQGHTNMWGFNIARNPQYPDSENAWITAPAGYIASSSNDLGTWLRMYLNGGEGVLSEQSIDMMLSGDTVFVDDKIPYWYGYGWNTIKDPLPETVYRHAGLVETGTACVYLIPSRDLGVALTANTNDYFVGNEMLDSLGWGLVLLLLGMEPNDIDMGSFFWRHALLNGLMLSLVLVGVLSCLLISRRVRQLRQASFRFRVAYLVGCHVALPVFLALLPQLLFQTPLWVARAFVPDFYAGLLISAALLFASGLAELVLLQRVRKTTIVSIPMSAKSAH